MLFSKKSELISPDSGKTAFTTCLTISLTQGTNVPVSPQSMLFIPPLGQLAVVDGQLQGLVLIDLNTLTFAHAPYF